MLEELKSSKDQREIPVLGFLPYMVHWYGPGALTKTGLLTVISGLFGQYADQRVLQAALDSRDPMTLVDRYDYSRGVAKLTIEENEPLWVDYVADLGDGFDSTYAMAMLLAADRLEVEGVDGSLPAGRLLIIGGDAVYPYASEKEYLRRFIQPYDLTVFHRPATEKEATPRRLFMLPGNHDWYDGLAAFDRLFCQRRDGISDGPLIGPYRCRQHRSYWAIKLPHDWWIWGIDTQLSSSVDVGQIAYFHCIAQSMMASPNQAKVVLCIAEPAWHYGAQVGTSEAYSPNLLRILNLAIDTGKVCAVIAGDWHHYTRYFGLGHRLNLITAGGGGAYLSPTHQLPAKIVVPWTGSKDTKPQMIPFTVRGPASTDDRAVAAAGISVDIARREATQKVGPSTPPEAIYPSRRVSKRLSWAIPTSAVTARNFTFMGGLGVFYWLMTWLFVTTPVVQKGAAYEACKTRLAHVMNDLRSPAAKLAVAESGMCERPVILAGLIKEPSKKSPVTIGLLGYELYAYERPDISVSDYIYYLKDTGINQFALAILGILVFFMLYSFSGASHWSRKALEALWQWLAHVAAMVITYEVIHTVFLEPIRHSAFGQFLFGHGLLPGGLVDFTWHLIGAALMVVVGGLIGGLIWGLSLFLANRVFKTQHDNAFSILRHQNCKHFLRMRITPSELTIYPIALRKVPWRNGWRKANDKDLANGHVAAFLPVKPLRPELIEGPIVIRPAEVRDLTPGPQPKHHSRAIQALAAALDRVGDRR
jgi:hypothetical protein